MAKTTEPTLFEKHIEKIILGAAGLVLLVVLFVWVVSSPNGIQLPGEKFFSPDKIDAGLLTLAKSTQERIEAAKATPPTVPDWPTAFLDKVKNPFDPSQIGPYAVMTPGSPALKITGPTINTRLVSLPGAAHGQGPRLGRA